MQVFKMNMKTLSTEIKKKVQTNVNTLVKKQMQKGCSGCGKKK